MYPCRNNENVSVQIQVSLIKILDLHLTQNGEYLGLVKRMACMYFIRHYERIILNIGK